MKGLILILSIFTLTASAGSKKIVFLGDSLTFGYGIGRSDAFPSVIQSRLQEEAKTKGWKVINSGISGSTTASAPSRMKWVLKSKPEIVVLALGANDGLRGIATDDSSKNLANAIELAQGAGVTVILAGMKLPPNYGAAVVKKFDEIFPQLAKTYSIALIPFLLEGVAANPSLNISDGIHPNVEGHKAVAQNVYPYVKKAIYARSKKSP